MSRPVVVFVSLNLPEAHIIRSALEAHGIEAQVIGEHRSSLLGAISVRDASLEVVVAEEDGLRAREVLEATFRRDGRGRLSMVDGGEGGELTLSRPELCPACGAEWEPEFDVCWSCLHEL